MEFNLYKPTEVELFINQAYLENGLQFASDLEIERIAEIFKIDIRYHDGPTFAYSEENLGSVIHIQAYLRLEQRRERFFHELCHPIRHYGNQMDKRMPKALVDLQESQARVFQLYAAFPIYMLEEYQDMQSDQYIKIISEEFTLPESLVKLRIEQILRRIDQERRDIEFMERQKAIFLDKTDIEEPQQPQDKPREKRRMRLIVDGRH